MDEILRRPPRRPPQNDVVLGVAKVVAALRARGFCGAGGFGKAVAEPPHSKMGWTRIRLGRFAIRVDAGSARIARLGLMVREY
jgi:hypothetical protein